MPSSIAAAAGDDAVALVELRATTDGWLVAESPHAPAIKTNDTKSRLFTVADASTTSLGQLRASRRKARSLA